MRHIPRRRRLLIAAIAVTLAAGAALAAAFAGGGSDTTSGGSTDNGAPTSLATVREQPLSSQTQASGTLGYAHPATVVNLTGSSQSAAPTAAAPSVYTQLPETGETIHRGQLLYAVNDEPVLLLYGTVPAWRAFQPGMSAGRDVAELNANLRKLGYGNPGGDTFSSETEDAMLKLQAAHGLAQTGTLPLGSVVFEPGAVRIAAIDATLGASAQPGPALEVTSTRHQVAVQVDPSQQANVKAGEHVTVTLPDERTTAGVISKVGTVASSNSGSAGGTGSSAGNSGSSPMLEVDVRLLDENAAGALDQAPVQVAITTASIKRALVVPVDALLALGGGYAVETADSAGAQQLVPVTVGLFDDADGLVQVTGKTLHAGERVVVPAT